MSGSYDFTIEKGTYWNRALSWTADSVPVDLTGWTAHMQVRPAYANQTSVVLADLTDGSGITLGGTAGTILLELTGTQTAALSFDTAVYDLYLTNPSGRPTRLLEGIVTLSDQVTAS